MAKELFISYSRDDFATVLPFAEYIGAVLRKGYWIDLNGIESGEEFEDIIIKAIDECIVVLFMLSDSSLHSKWTKREIYYAESEGKIIIPVVLDGGNLRGWFKFHFGNVDYIDLQSEDQKIKLVNDLRLLLGVKENAPNESEQDINNEKSDSQALRFGASSVLTHKLSLNATILQKIIIISVLVAFFLAIFKCCVSEDSKSNPPVSDLCEDSLNIDEVNDKIYDFSLIPFQDDRTKLFGYKYESGFVVIPCKRKEAGPFESGLARVVDIHGKWHIINRDGKAIIPESFRFIEPDLGLMKIRNTDGKIGLIDSIGTFISPCQWIRVDEFFEGMAAVKGDNGKCGYIDKTGKEVIPCQWKWVSWFKEGLAWVEDDNENKGVIDKSGTVLFLCHWEEVWDFSEGLAKVMDSNGLIGFIDKNGLLVSPCQWKAAGSFSESLAPVMDSNRKWGYIDRMGKSVIPCQWIIAGTFYEGLAPVKGNNGKWGYLDITGKVVIPYHWKSADRFAEDRARVEDDNGKYGYINKAGMVVIECQWDRADTFFKGFASVVDENGRKWWIDKTGKVIGEKE